MDAQVATDTSGQRDRLRRRLLTVSEALVNKCGAVATEAVIEGADPEAMLTLAKSAREWAGAASLLIDRFRLEQASADGTSTTEVPAGVPDLNAARLERARREALELLPPGRMSRQTT